MAAQAAASAGARLRILEGLGWLSLDDSLIGRVKYEIWVRHENVQQLAYGFFLAEDETIRRAEDGSGKLKLQLENSSESIELLITDTSIPGSVQFEVTTPFVEWPDQLRQL